MDETTWPGDWLRGVLEVCVLRVLADGPTYGYAVAQSLADAGLGSLKGGTLYPLLARFETAGLVEIQWRAGEGGPGRKYYALTAAGHRALREKAARWSAFARLTTELVTSEPTGSQPATPELVAVEIVSDLDPIAGPQQVRNGARP